MAVEMKQQYKAKLKEIKQKHKSKMEKQREQLALKHIEELGKVETRVE